MAGKHKDIVGFAFAINGRINSAEIYPSNGLFAKMWPKLLKSSVRRSYMQQNFTKLHENFAKVKIS